MNIMFLRKSKYNILKNLQILSIDVVLGTMAIGYLAIRILNVEANPIWWIILPLSVWIIYSLDHIIDGSKNKQEATIYRHWFHYLHQNLILTFIVLASVINLVLCLLYLDIHIIIMGLLLSIFIAIYFALIFFLKSTRVVLLQKELIIAFVYTFGIFMAPLYWYGSLPSIHVMIVIFIIFILAWFEGIMISFFEYFDDIKDGHTSFTVIAGKRNTRLFLIIGHMIIEIIAIILLIIIPVDIVFYALLIALIMNLILGIVTIYPENLENNNTYKFIGEFVFLLPVLLVFV